MRFYRPLKLISIIQRTGFQPHDFTIVGEQDAEVLGLDDYQVALPRDITWVDFESLYNQAFKSDASVVIINSMPKDYPNDKTIVIVDDPKSFFDSVASCVFEEQFPPRSFISRIFNPKDKVIGKNCKIDRSVKIGSHVHIGDNVTIEPFVVIHDNVFIGDNVIIRSHCDIGGHPFSHTKQQDGTYVPRNSWGNTIILDDADLAPLTNIDRGITGSTIIGSGTKTCAMCQIGHDTWIGRNGYICSGVTIAGYVRIGNDCQFWGQAGVSSSVHIADDTNVEACAMVLKNVKQPGQSLAGFPAEPKQTHWKRAAIIRKMASEYEQ